MAEGVELIESRETGGLGPGGRGGKSAFASRVLSHVQHGPNINYTTSVRPSVISARSTARPAATRVTSCRATSCWRRLPRPCNWAAIRFCWQGGLHPTLPLEWYEDLLRDIQRHYPRSTSMGSVSGDSPFHKDLQVAAAHHRCWNDSGGCGLGSIPGRDGAEILVDRVPPRHHSGKV